MHCYAFVLMLLCNYLDFGSPANPGNQLWSRNRLILWVRGDPPETANISPSSSELNFIK